jgi:hypothetical protein
MLLDRRAAQLLVTSSEAVIDAAERHMPAGPYRDFTVWAFSTDNPRQADVHQATGLIQIVNLNIMLFDGVVADEDWPTMLYYAAQLSAYQIYEVISGSLGMGLGRLALDDSGLQRLALIRGLQNAMSQALAPDNRQPAVLLLSGPVRQAAAQASGFELSLAGATHATIAEEYVQWCREAGRPEPTAQDLEYGLWAALIANVETCRGLLEGLVGTVTLPLLRQGLLDRYRAVERTLWATHLDRLELSVLGAHSILVSPSLAYAICVMYEVLVPLPAYPSVISDGSLGDAIIEASLLIRLQNDIGPHLLRMPPGQRAVLLSTVARRSAETGCVTADDLLDLLLRVGRDDPSFTRLDKDLARGETNVALWHPRRARDAVSALSALSDSLAFFAAQHDQHSARLATCLAALDDRLGDQRASVIIRRFVQFHDRMFGLPHTEKTGEYAI